MRNILEILTPENVHVDFEIAGLGSRFIALVIDTFIQLVMIILTIIIMAMGNIGELYGYDTGYTNSVLVAISLILVFLIVFGYFIFFEMLLKGQSPGKKVMKLKVIKQTGEPINFLDSAMRNFFRIVYMVPVLHILEAGLVIMSKNYMRIGDFAANTIVVKIKNNEELVTVDSILEKTIVKDEMDIDSVNIYPLNNFEYRVLKEFLARKNNLGSRRPVFAYNLNLYFMKKFNVEKTYSNPYDFFEDIIKMNSGI